MSASRDTKRYDNAYLEQRQCCIEDNSDCASDLRFACFDQDRSLLVFEIITVDENAAENVENLGSKEKFWFRNSSHELSLFKAVRQDTGEDWAEKIAEQIAIRLGLPCANYELAVWKGKKGVITPSIVPEGASLVHGNELLVAQGSDYPRRGTANNFKNSQHTLDIVMKNIAVCRAELPPKWDAPDGIVDAQGLFIGYLLLDALIGNADRHHENWAIIERIVSSPTHSIERYLAPTFDHASSMGRSLPDVERTNRLQTKDRTYSVEAFAEKGPSRFYERVENSKPLKSMSAFQISAQQKGNAALVWLERLEGVEDAEIEHFFRLVPQLRITEPAILFGIRMLASNRKRLLTIGEDIK